MDERPQQDDNTHATEVGSLEVLSLDGKGASKEELTQARRTVAFLEGLVPSLADEGEAAQALHDLGQLQLHPLNEPAAALEALREAYGKRPALHIARAYRKAALRAGSVEDQLRALDGEARAATTPAYRAALETERGALFEKTGNTTAARQAYLAAVEANPSELTALLAQLQLALSDGDNSEAMASCRRIAEATTDPRVKAEYLAWAARLLEAAGDVVAALAAAVQAEVHAPESPSVSFLLERLFGASDQPRELCARLEAHIVAAAVPPAEGWFEIGILTRYHLGDLEAAERAFTHAAEKAEGPSKAAAQAELADLWARKGQWQKVLDAEEAGLPDGGEALGRAVAWTRIGQLREERLGNLDGAADAYKTALEAAPGYVPALEGAGRAFAKQSDVERLLWMHRAEADNAASPAGRAAALRRAGELMLDDAARADEGIKLLQEALVAAPDHAGIFATLERVLRQKKAYPELLALYERELARVGEPRRRAWLLLQIGELAADRLDDSRRAIDAFRGAAEIPGGAPHIALTRLAQLLEDTGDLTALESVLAELTSWTEDPVQLASLYERAAQLQEKRGDLEAALASHRRGLEVAPRAHAIEAAAGRTFARAERWDDLLALFERAASDGSELERADYGYKAGLLLARRMGRSDDGIARLEAVRAASPNHLPTLVALAGLYQEGQRWAALRPILAELPSTPALAVRRAALAEVTGHADEALTLWESLAEAGMTVAARPRARLLARLGRWPRLAALYETTQPNGIGDKWSANARYRAAELYSERTGERPRAAELLAAALVADPDSLPLMLALLRALDVDSPARRATLTGIVGRLRDPALRAALLGQLANTLGDGESLATRVNQMALAPRDPVVAVRIEVALEARHNREALAALLRDLRRDPKANEALVAAAAARLGTLLEELGTLRDAADAFEASVASAHPSFLARLALPRLYGALGDETRLGEALRGLADAV
ncbi:MAG: domain protein putative component of TonB system, partial [Myxococcales bacterium]|nr:domain protein putative component of TonB system [Myxococcales bacterium]